MAALTIVDIRKEFASLIALDEISLTIASGEFFSVLGPSGCGKTTLLRVIAGFDRPGRGRVLLDGEDITLLPPQGRHIGMVFQNYALFPHMTVFDNVAFGLRAHGEKAADLRPRVEKAVAIVGLESKISTRVPYLSGGEQQRVALARALVLEPKVLLCDEPLSNLDLSLRMQMREQIRTLQRRTGITTVYVTHDQTEAMSLSDHIAVMRMGRVEQIGTPDEVYRSPATPYVAQFLGSANLVEGELLEGGRMFRSYGLNLILPDDSGRPSTGQCIAAIKPESIQLERPDSRRGTAGILEDTEYLGYVTTATVKAGDVRLHVTALSSEWTRSWRPGNAVRIVIDWEGCRFFPKDGK